MAAIAIDGPAGAGKSTISRAFAKVAGKQEDTIESAFVINGSADEVVLTDADRAHIHVFNEQYVDNNIKFRPDGKGLETIVVLGKANAIEKDMAKLGLWTNPYKCTEADYYGEIDNGWLNNNPKLVKNPYQ